MGTLFPNEYSAPLWFPFMLAALGVIMIALLCLVFKKSR